VSERIVNGTPAALLFESLQAFLREEVQGQLSGFTAYNNRIAANLLATLAREQELGPDLAALDRDFAARRGLDPQAMPGALALALRDGSQADDAQLTDYLRRRTLLAMAIDNPRYPGYREARERWKQQE